MLSYRRDDSGLIAGRICDRLRTQYGRDAVYMDIDSAPIGVDYRTHIKDSLARCDVLLAVIGRHWLGTGDIGARRIDEPDDLVHLEVAHALARDIRVVPLLVEDAQMPSREELPEDLKGLKYRNALRIDSGVDFHHHLDRLCKAIEVALPASPPVTPPVLPPLTPTVLSPATVPAEANEASLPSPPGKKEAVTTISTPPPLPTTFAPALMEKKETPSHDRAPDRLKVLERSIQVLFPLAVLSLFAVVPIAVALSDRTRVSSLAMVPLVCSPLVPIASIILGHLTRKQIRRNPYPGADGLVTAGLVLGYAVLAICIITVIMGFARLGEDPYPRFRGD